MLAEGTNVLLAPLALGRAGFAHAQIKAVRKDAVNI